MPFIGEIRASAGNIVPTGWAHCDGQVLPVVGNAALFNVLGYRFGGSGASFALPDLRGRVPIGQGQGPGLSNRTAGSAGGTETHPLAVDQLPAHSHVLRASTENGSSDDPANRVMARTPSAIPNFRPSADSNMAAGAVANAGSGQAHNNMQPFLTVKYIIALTGSFPTPG